MFLATDKINNNDINLQLKLVAAKLYAQTRMQINFIRSPVQQDQRHKLMKTKNQKKKYFFLFARNK